jgi:hypothetical protein
MSLNLDFTDYYYGSVPEIPVAEQNQTYFAYWNGIGGSRPEYMDGSSYFIKYLIDINGNVINPEPYTETTNIDAVALHNLKANFEIGKRATVKLIEPDPTQASAPNANSLKGTHTIAHVGRIIPILVTETGENRPDYITTMSFGPPSTQTVVNVVTPARITPQVTTNYQYTGGEYTIQGEWQETIFDTEYSTTSPVWQNVDGSTKKILSSSAETGTRIRFKIDMYLEETWNANNGFNWVEVGIAKNSTDVDALMSIWNPLTSFSTQEGDITPYSSFSNTARLYRPSNLSSEYDNVINDGQGGVWTTGWSKYFDYDADDDFGIFARAYDGRNIREVKVKGLADSRAQTIFSIQQETPAGITPATTEVALINRVNITTSSYFVRLDNNPNPDNGGYSVLTLSPGLTSMLNTGYSQNIDPASITFGFSSITEPFSSLKPGDFIRFEYNKSQTYTIFSINPTTRDVDSGGLQYFENVIDLYVTPSLSDVVSPAYNSDNINDFYIDLNHFQIYRVLNDGLYVTLDVTPDWGPGGNAFTGLIIPEFISQELSEKLETLIQDLTQKEIIQ